MTIASHCVELLRANGPMTREELGESCRVARVTAAKDPALAVQGALQSDGRVLRVDASYYLVERLLEGRWLALERPCDPERFDPDIDLQCLQGLASKEGVPLATGGRLTRSTYGVGWTGPPGWAPPGDVIGLRLDEGVAHVASLDVDDNVWQRGEQLITRLDERMSRRSYAGLRRFDVAAALLELLREDDDLLREPLPPLRQLFPAPPTDARRYGPVGALQSETVHVAVSPQVYSLLAEAADDAGVPVAIWLADELARLHAWPRWPVVPDFGQFAGPWGDDSGGPEGWTTTGERRLRPLW